MTTRKRKRKLRPWLDRVCSHTVSEWLNMYNIEECELRPISLHRVTDAVTYREVQIKTGSHPGWLWHAFSHMYPESVAQTMFFLALQVSSEQEAIMKFPELINI